MMTHTDNTIFAIILTASVFTFGFSVARLIRAIRLGKPDLRLRKSLVKRFATMLGYAFGQKRVLDNLYGLNHFLLFWGFMILFIYNAAFVLNGLFPEFSLSLAGPFLYPILTLLFDLIPLLVVICVIIAVGRRVLVKPAHIDYRSVDAFIILGMVFSLMFLFYGYHGCTIALEGTKSQALMPFTERFVAPIMSGIFGSALPAAGRVFWWLHALVFLAFLNYLPYSKHLHILTAIPNCFCRSFEPVRTVPREVFGPGRTYGVSRADQFSWKDLLDFTSCTECGRCNQVCPATNTHKPLNPRFMIHDGKINLFANAEKLHNGNRSEGLMPLIVEKDASAVGSVGEDALWDCTTCGACMAVCPVLIEHVPKIIKMRRHLVENLVKFPDELSIFFEAIEQRSNPWGLAPSDRTRWAKGLDIPVISELPEGEPVEYLFYVGCAGSFDSRSRKVAVALAKIMKAADIKFGILGVEEKCCGDSLRRLGNEYVFEKIAKENVELFSKRGIQNIVCYCPHCYTTLKNDYAQFGLNARVIHYTELLPDLIRQGRLKLSGGNGNDRVLFHDSCYLGRHNGIFDQPRGLIKSATGKDPLEMDRTRQKAFCCGAGGGRMWMEEDPADRINLNRVREALGKNPDTIAVTCPYCMTMFEDGVKDLQADQHIKVMDIVEIIAEQIKAP
ncbi:MAG: 4Fe-4S dicluster domain-containing protein [Deltaproteobacteria bacterium]|nr:4Fe-4S dicluster domain-containing protein [Deltaproteobacteria bacterium]